MNADPESAICIDGTIFGGRTVVGHDSVIGSNVGLTSSVQPHTTVLLEKPNFCGCAARLPDELGERTAR